MSDPLLYGFFVSPMVEILEAIASKYPELMDTVNGNYGFWGKSGNSPIAWRDLEILISGERWDESISHEVSCLYAVWRQGDLIEFHQCNEGYPDGDTTVLHTMSVAEISDLNDCRFFQKLLSPIAMPINNT